MREPHPIRSISFKRSDGRSMISDRQKAVVRKVLAIADALFRIAPGSQQPKHSTGAASDMIKLFVARGKVWLRAAALSSCVAVMGCATTATTMLPTVDVVQYRLSPGDRLKLEVFREEGLSGEYVVNDKGTIGLPMVGEITAAGKTITQLRDELTATLGREYVRNPQLNLDVVTYRPIYILGEVQNPGEYAYTDKMSVYALVAKAGGFTYRANEGVVFIRHANESAETAYKLTSGASVLPGDTVRIDRRYF